MGGGVLTWVEVLPGSHSAQCGATERPPTICTVGISGVTPDYKQLLGFQLIIIKQCKGGRENARARPIVRLPWCNKWHWLSDVMSHTCDKGAVLWWSNITGDGGSTRDQFEVKEAIVRNRSLPLTPALLTGLSLRPGRACVLIHMLTF